MFSTMDWKLLICEGAKAVDLLHGQSSCDLVQTPNDSATIAAFCTPKGKTYATALMHKATDTSVHIIIDASLTERLMHNLRKYLPFFRCALYAPEVTHYDYSCDASKQLTSPGLFPVVQQNDWYAIMLGQQSFCYSVGHDTNSVTECQQHTPSVLWQERWLRTGYPLLNQQSSELYTPNMLNFDKHAGVSFTKGCYTGQEIVARTYYKGQVKRRLHFATTCTQEITPTLFAQDTACGSWLHLVQDQSKGTCYGQVMVNADAQTLHTGCGVLVEISPFIY